MSEQNRTVIQSVPLRIPRRLLEAMQEIADTTDYAVVVIDAPETKILKKHAQKMGMNVSTFAGLLLAAQCDAMENGIPLPVIQGGHAGLA